MNLFTIPAGADFLETLAAGWLEARGGDPERIVEGIILLPTRRAARALTETFLRLAAPRPVLLPRILALGALDEEPLGLTATLGLPPAVSPFVRLAELTRLLLARSAGGGAASGGPEGLPATAEQAWPLAEELARLLDEAGLEEVDLAAGLDKLLEEGLTAEFAEHWQATRDLLALLTRDWPDWLQKQGLSDRAAHLIALLDAQGSLWQQRPPAFPVWAAGSTGGIPAVARLLRVVARLPEGRVILPGFDPEAARFAPLPETHPQAKMLRLIKRIGADPDKVAPWPGEVRRKAAAAREELLRTALLPGAALARWQETDVSSEALAGLYRLETANEQEEAEAIALILREALETPGRRAALITPDRALAERVRTELLRYDVVIDDSAGEPLLGTPPAVFLRLLAEAASRDFALLPMLALLKHPLAALGLAPEETRRRVRRLEHVLRRGQWLREIRFAALRRFLDRQAGAGEKEEIIEIIDLITRFENAVRPLEELKRGRGERGAAGEEKLGAFVAPRRLIEALLEAGEAVAADDASPGEARLWAYEEGVALAGLLREALPALDALPPEPFSNLRGLFEALIGDASVRTRRSVRGREAAEHPRLVIWGLLEARLQSADLVVLGGLVEGVWPAEADPGPWLNRPMRAVMGFPSPEEKVGDAAHDFFTAAAAAPTVILSAPRRRDRAPAVPSRWLERLDALTGGLPRHPAGEWVRRLDRPSSSLRPAPRPAPSPPLDARPKRLSVSDVARWQANPYAIYAKHILRLSPLLPLHFEIGRAEFGTLAHEALARWAKQDDREAPREARIKAFLDVFEGLRIAEDLHPALVAWWRPRFLAIIEAVLDWEGRQPASALCAIERKGAWQVDERLPFELTARADRIERGAGGGFVIIDYKTGALSEKKEILAGQDVQLSLEAVMLEQGGFGADLTGQVEAILYLRPGRGRNGGNYAERKIDGEALPPLLAETEAKLRGLIEKYYIKDPLAPYTAYAVADRDYALLARTEEWRGT